jgi:hypothetical protein
MIALLVVGISKTEMAQKLDVWSYQQFNKPIFNGRDTIWEDGFQRLGNHILFGSGYLIEGYWHNSAIACLTAYGLIGFGLWVNSIYYMIEKARVWIKDYIIEGCIVAFLVLYVQQSVELGLFAPNPNLIPYIMLGMMLGRIGYLKNQGLECEELHYGQD